MTTPNKTPPGADPKQLERTGTVREIGSQAVWSLSSCKPVFRRKTTVKTLCIYADYKSDESYTPSKISVRVGNNFHNLQEIRNQTTPPGTSLTCDMSEAVASYPNPFITDGPFMSDHIMGDNYVIA
ncbi:PREDICTED: anaphase-promoting complex subunit 10 [Chrysochloris asiatica]|uniref:Anaphase-promoting complex subunit 10 n=1 Tax=Chrysochloris asiatica TaxID=185453 RepID=A0A9B0U2J4_CHRAS|nr:PREDICTED: anaphase-promoting complex subunit 10 [Chrysochloris asiatica]